MPFTMAPHRTAPLQHDFAGFNWQLSCMHAPRLTWLKFKCTVPVPDVSNALNVAVALQHGLHSEGARHSPQPVAISPPKPQKNCSMGCTARARVLFVRMCCCANQRWYLHVHATAEGCKASAATWQAGSPTLPDHHHHERSLRRPLAHMPSLPAHGAREAAAAVHTARAPPPEEEGERKELLEAQRAHVQGVKALEHRPQGCGLERVPCDNMRARQVACRPHTHSLPLLLRQGGERPPSCRHLGNWKRDSGTQAFAAGLRARLQARRKLLECPRAMQPSSPKRCKAACISSKLSRPLPSVSSSMKLFWTVDRNAWSRPNLHAGRHQRACMSARPIRTSSAERCSAC